MNSWTLYPVFVGTAISIVTLSHIAISNRDKLQTRTLSELITLEERLLKRFRNTLLICGTLFAITMFAYIVPRVQTPLPVLLLSVAVIVSELLAGIIPAHNAIKSVHEALAGLMAGGMLLLPYVFWREFSGAFSTAEIVLAVFMTAAAVLLLADKNRKQFVMFELLFIFASHISIMLAAVAVA